MLEEKNIYFRQATPNQVPEHAVHLRIQFPIYRAATAKTQVVMLVLLGTHGVESIEINSREGYFFPSVNRRIKLTTTDTEDGSE